MSKTETTMSVPADWLRRAVNLLDSMASEGIGMDGHADPADLMSELADGMGFSDEDDPWMALTLFLGGPANAG